VDRFVSIIFVELGRASLARAEPQPGGLTVKSLLFVLAILTVSNSAFAFDEKSQSSPNQAITFSVGPDEALSYPTDLVNLPDEHTTILPPKHRFDPYLFFSSSSLKGESGGAIALESFDLKTFDFPSGYQPHVMTPPIDFTTCKSVYDPEFDLNYAAPGSVLQDPTLPPGNLIMIYEAENHCPGSAASTTPPVWQRPFYATVGFARSSDNGKTWPQPVDSEFGGADRHPVLKGPVAQPPTNFPGNMGDAIPSGFVDRNFLYIVYSFTAGAQSDGLIRIARAKLEGDDHESGEDQDSPGKNDHQLTFLKWNNGAFSEPGIGGVDTGVLPASGCPGRQVMPELNYNDDLGLYLMIFVCNSNSVDGHAAWYFSTAASLERQDWTEPQLIVNSRQPIISPCNLKDNSGSSFDGFYPSFMSPEARAGHTRNSGRVYFLNGCDTALPRAFMSRTFTIAGPSHRKAEDED
jgi:hypothetical protein